MPRKEQALRTEFEIKLTRSLEGRGYQVRRYMPDEIEKKLVGANSVVEQIKNAYRSAAARVLYARPVPDTEARMFRVSMGPVGSDLGRALDADAFLLTNYQGYGQSKGLAVAELGTAALTVIAGGTPAGGSTPLPFMELALVDAATGNILWTYRSYSPSPLGKSSFASERARSGVGKQGRVKRSIPHQEVRDTARWITNNQCLASRHLGCRNLVLPVDGAG